MSQNFTKFSQTSLKIRTICRVILKYVNKLSPHHSVNLDWSIWFISSAGSWCSFLKSFILELTEFPLIAPKNVY